MYSLGIDLGGTNIVASVVDDQYNIISTAKTKTNAPRPATLPVRSLTNAVCEVQVWVVPGSARSTRAL